MNKQERLASLLADAFGPLVEVRNLLQDPEVDTLTGGIAEKIADIVDVVEDIDFMLLVKSLYPSGFGPTELNQFVTDNIQEPIEYCNECIGRLYPHGWHEEHCSLHPANIVAAPTPTKPYPVEVWWKEGAPTGSPIVPVERF